VGGGRRLGLVKYADDLVILCATGRQADQAGDLVAAVLDGVGLRLGPEKTRIAGQRLRQRRLALLASAKHELTGRNGVGAFQLRVVDQAPSIA
jgi:hypothetical protein